MLFCNIKWSWTNRWTFIGSGIQRTIEPLYPKPGLLWKVPSFLLTAKKLPTCQISCWPYCTTPYMNTHLYILHNTPNPSSEWPLHHDTLWKFAPFWTVVSLVSNIRRNFWKGDQDSVQRLFHEFSFKSHSTPKRRLSVAIIGSLCYLVYRQGSPLSTCLPPTICMGKHYSKVFPLGKERACRMVLSAWLLQALIFLVIRKASSGGRWELAKVDNLCFRLIQNTLFFWNISHCRWKKCCSILGFVTNYKLSWPFSGAIVEKYEPHFFRKEVWQLSWFWGELTWRFIPGASIFYFLILMKMTRL